MQQVELTYLKFHMAAQNSISKNLILVQYSSSNVILVVFPRSVFWF